MKVRSTFVLAALLASVSAWAQDAVPHEFVPNVDPQEPLRVLSQAGAAPNEVAYGDEVLSAQSSAAHADAPPMIATPGDGAQGELPGQRSPTFAPDRLTELEGTLDYYAAFKPSIAPFKRVTSLDATLLARDGYTPLLGIGDGRRRKVAVAGDSLSLDARPRDRFWGEATLDFSRGRVLPLPSVSPESRILSLRTEPAIALTIERDGADNFFAVAAGPLPTAPVFVAFLTDAPRAYFGTEIPKVPLATLNRALHPLDKGIAERALKFAAELGISTRSDLRTALFTLTQHFRSFEESTLPPRDSGDIYLDLARGKKGVCRHRAYAFVVTAHALGIPARLLQNEAHSWVEVELPQIGFMRIDLGGAAHGLAAHGANDRPSYHPSQPDPLPRPSAYEESYSLLQGATGLRKPSKSELIGRWVKPADNNSAAQAQATFMAAPNAEASDASGRVPVRLTLGKRDQSVLRGQALSVAGQLRDAQGVSLSNHSIEVSLAQEGRPETLLLGMTASDAQGAFTGDFAVPADLATGDYRLIVVAPGDQAYLPAIAE